MTQDNERPSEFGTHTRENLLDVVLDKLQKAGKVGKARLHACMHCLVCSM